MAEITDWQTSSNVTEAPPSVPVDTPTPPATESEPATAPTTEKPDEPQEEPPEDRFERDAKGRIKRHRNKNQVASPEDVPRIRELTQKYRELERKYNELAPKPAETSHALPKPLETPQSGGFSEAEPTLEQFADRPDPYAAYLRATAAYDRKKEAFEAHQKAQAEAAKSSQAQMEAQWKRIFDAHTQRLAAYTKDVPNYQERLAKAPGTSLQATPVLHTALMMDDKGPEKILYLAEHPAELRKLLLDTHSMPISDQNVALVRDAISDLLDSRGKDVVTGSPSSTPLTLAPRPLNPVRTAPTTPPDTLPGDDASLEEHERVWGRHRRRRA